MQYQFAVGSQRLVWLAGALKAAPRRKTVLVMHPVLMACYLSSPLSFCLSPPGPRARKFVSLSPREKGAYQFYALGLSSVGDVAIDLPDANVLIQVPRPPPPGKPRAALGSRLGVPPWGIIHPFIHQPKLPRPFPSKA